MASRPGYRLVACWAILSVTLALRLPQPLLTPPRAVLPSVSRARGIVLLAKKKKAKAGVNKAAAAALEALDAMEANLPPPPGLGAEDDGLTPVVAKKGKKPKKKLKVDTSDDEPPPLVAPIAPLEPVAEAPVPAPAAAPAAPTMAEKVARIKVELGLDDSLALAAAVKAANEAMGLEPAGAMADQVATLLEQLGVDMAPPAAAPVAPPPPPPSPPPPAPAPAPPPAEAAAEDEAAAAVAEAEEAAEEPAPQEVTLSKKKMGKQKAKQKAASGDEAAEGDEAGAAAAAAEEGRDQSGRKAFSTRVEQFADAPPGFAYVKMSNGKLRFRNQEVLRGVSWDVQTGQRVGLVGSNGAGKTTQLRVLAGELELDEGEIVKSSGDLKIAFLRQEFREEMNDEATLRDELLSTFSDVLTLQSRYDEAEAQLAALGEEDMEAMQGLLDKMAQLQAELDTADASALERRVDRVMGAMGFTPEDAALPVSAFSGGWKMRIGLAKILLQEPQVLLLDEPTNHMDLESVEWLERYLVSEQMEKLALVIVSHDREFLDRVSTKIVETNQGVAYSYNGNYRSFLGQKADREALEMERYEKQQKQIKELKSDIQKLGNLEGNAVTVRQKERQLKDMEEGGAEHVPRPFVEKKKFNFRFPPAPRCAQEVIALEGVGHGYGGSTLFSDVDLVIERGDRIAILGPNGAGKSTLLRLIMGTESPREGEAGVVANNAEVHYFEQDQANALPLDKTVLQTMEDAGRSTDFVYEQIRALLGKFMFKAEKVNDKLATLSGGEKARVAMCRMMLTPANVLLLDEPTNHLDIGAKEVLEEAIQNFEGTVVMVSHDRYFVSQTANTILALEEGKMVVYDGDYADYMQQNDKTKELVEGRYIDGLQKIRHAPKIELQPEELGKKAKKKKNFGGKGGPSGNKNKGVKNAKRATALT